MISLNQHVAPIEVIEGDSFISTAFVDQIFLDGIPAKYLNTNAFRGLSFCKALHLTNTFIEEIHANAFYRANHIEMLNLKNSRIKVLNKDAFSGMFSIDTIDLSGNYISKLSKSTFEQLIAIEPQKPNIINKSSITVIDQTDTQRYLVKRLLLEQNPIQCDCNMAWLLTNKAYTDHISLPEICAGPKGYDCLRVSDLTVEKLACSKRNDGGKEEFPCEDLEFDYNKSQTLMANDIFAIQKTEGKKQFIDIHQNTDEDESSEDYEHDEYTGEADYEEEADLLTTKHEQHTAPTQLASKATTAVATRTGKHKKTTKQANTNIIDVINTVINKEPLRTKSKGINADRNVIFNNVNAMTTNPMRRDQAELDKVRTKSADTFKALSSAAHESCLCSHASVLILIVNLIFFSFL